MMMRSIVCTERIMGMVYLVMMGTIVCGECAVRMVCLGVMLMVQVEQARV